MSKNYDQYEVKMKPHLRMAPGFTVSISITMKFPTGFLVITILKKSDIFLTFACLLLV